jgi:hypothetical protein
MISAGKKLSSPPQDMGTYEYLANAGEGVWVYVLDSGSVPFLTLIYTPFLY